MKGKHDIKIVCRLKSESFTGFSKDLNKTKQVNFIFVSAIKSPPNSDQTIYLSLKDRDNNRLFYVSAGEYAVIV